MIHLFFIFFMVFVFPAHADVTDGLVGWWKLDEGSGTSATDSSGNNNIGTLTNGPTWVSGKKAGAVNFDGADDSINAANSASLTDVNLGSQLSISVWFKRNVVSGGWIGVVTKAGASGLRNYELGFAGGSLGTSSNALAFAYRNDTNTSWIVYATSATYSDSRWHHAAVALTIGTPASVKIYVDGVVSAGAWTNGSGTETPYNSNGTLYIGRTEQPEFFSGYLDDVRVYNRALSANEVMAIYQAGTPRFSLKGSARLNGLKIP